MGIKIFKMDICPLELIKDDKTEKLSATKLWMHIGNIILSKLMLQQTNVTYEIILAYGAVVAGSYVGMSWLKRKYKDDKNES